MKERLTLVTSESQLRPGLLVEVRSCRRCGAGKHRYLLLRLEEGVFYTHSLEDARDGIGWRTAPGGCIDGGKLSTALAIPERRLFIVETGLDIGADAIEGHRLYSQPRVKERAR